MCGLVSMKSEIISLDAAGVGGDLATYHPPKGPFGFSLMVSLRPTGTEVCEVFYIGVCNPEWLLAASEAEPGVRLFPYILMEKYDYQSLRRITEVLFVRSGADGDEIVKKISSYSSFGG